jgi:hypothetical protein
MGRYAGGMSHSYRCMSHNESALVQEVTNIVAKLAQKFGQLRPFIAVFPQGGMCRNASALAVSLLSLCVTIHPRYTRFANRLGASISETTMRPNPAPCTLPAALTHLGVRRNECAIRTVSFQASPDRHLFFPRANFISRRTAASSHPLNASALAAARPR